MLFFSLLAQHDFLELHIAWYMTYTIIETLEIFLIVTLSRECLTVKNTDTPLWRYIKKISNQHNFNPSNTYQTSSFDVWIILMVWSFCCRPYRDKWDAPSIPQTKGLVSHKFLSYTNIQRFKIQESSFTVIVKKKEKSVTQWIESHVKWTCSTSFFYITFLQI